MAEATTTQIARFIQTTATMLCGSACDVSLDGSGDQGSPIRVHVSAPQHGSVLIGRDGKNLAALERITRAVMARIDPGAPVVIVDANDYKQSKTNTLIEEVRTVMARVSNTGKSEALHPMDSYERRIVHTELASSQILTSESGGQEAHRRVVIKPV